MWAPLPVGVENPAECLRKIAAAMDGPEEVRPGGRARRCSRTSPGSPRRRSSARPRACRLASRSSTSSSRTCPGPQFPLYLLGRRLEVLYPVVPLAQRQALGIAVMSYDGHLGFGLLGDYDALPDLEEIALDLKWAIAALAPRSRRAPAGQTRAPRALARRHKTKAAREDGTRVAAKPARAGDRGAATRSTRVEQAGRRRRLQVRLALCQINATVGDIAGNAERIRDGHPRRPRRGRGARRCSPSSRSPATRPRTCCSRSTSSPTPAPPCTSSPPRRTDLVAVVGFPERAEDVYNAAAVLAGGAVHAIYRKVYLPNYGVFDEQRYFQAGPAGAVHRHRRRPRRADGLRGHLGAGPARQRRGARRRDADRQHLRLALPRRQGLRARADVRPARARQPRLRRLLRARRRPGRARLRRALVRARPHRRDDRARRPVRARSCSSATSTSQAAAAARLRDASHRPAARRSERARSGAAGAAARRARRGVAGPPPVGPAPLRASRLRRSRPRSTPRSTLGLRDYVHKNGFAARRARPLRRDRLGARRLPRRRRARGRARVSAVIMPSPYSSAGHPGGRPRARPTRSASRRIELPIEPVDGTPTSDTLRAASSPAREPDLTEENLQARIRGNLLMALSNKFGWLVLTTGNKSEMSVGYTTLYGDLAGGFAVIKDVPKTLVYRLCEWRNSRRAATRRAPGLAARAHARGEPPIPGIDHRARALGRAAPRPARRGLAAALRGARPHPRGLRRARPQPRAADRAGPARGRRRARRSAWSTWPSTSAARRRPGSRSPRARSAATGACRSPTATAAERLATRRPDPRSTLRACIACTAAASSARRALRARARRVRQHAAGPADPAQHPRGADRRAATPCTGSAAPSTACAISEASDDPGGAFSVSYGDCVQGGQGTACRRCGWSPRPTTASSPAAPAPARSDRRPGRRRRRVAQEGRTIAIATGRRGRRRLRAQTRAWRGRGARTIVPINALGAPGAAAARAPSPDTGFGRNAAARAAARRRCARSADDGLRLRERGRRGSGRTAIVIRVTAQVRSASSLKRTSQTHVVRPRCRRVASACTVPAVIGRRKLVLFDRPIAISPCSSTASAVAIEAIDSAIDAYTPPCTSPAGCLISSRTGTRARTSCRENDSNSRP